jgi:alkanesulfonate monooxygenase SsuD/methylene tetrahydromethanopterin reductase-like flavin-dependent oxidoreductase (luciferase family)
MMNTSSLPPIGVVLGSHMPHERIVPTARKVEELGFGELWFSEDCFFAGGIAGTAAALAATREIPVGLGVVSAVTRHPAILAMELATLDRLFPGRVIGGIGHGVPAWLDQMGLMPSRPLKALRECVTSVRALHEGDTLTADGRFRFVDVTLTHRPAGQVPLYLGVVNDMGMRASGELADGTILSVLASPAYVEWARARISEGAAKAGRDGRQHKLVTFALYSVAHDPKVAKKAVRDVIAFYLAAMPKTALSRVYGIQDQLTALVNAGGAATIAREMPAEWIEDLAVAGDPDECAEKLRTLLQAGSDSIGLWLFPTDQSDEVAVLTAREVLPKL